MSLQEEIKQGLYNLFDIDNKSIITTDIDGEITTVELSEHPMKGRIDSFAETLANSILKLKIDLQSTENPSGKLNITGTNGGGTVVWISTSQTNGALSDK